jgi:hypothetical protein
MAGGISTMFETVMRKVSEKHWQREEIILQVDLGKRKN